MNTDMFEEQVRDDQFTYEELKKIVLAVAFFSATDIGFPHPDLRIPEDWAKGYTSALEDLKQFINFYELSK